MYKHKYSIYKLVNISVDLLWYQSLFLYRKSLNKGVLLYVHLNLAVALLAALVIFVAGIENAKSIDVSIIIHISLPSVCNVGYKGGVTED